MNKCAFVHLSGVSLRAMLVFTLALLGLGAAPGEAKVKPVMSADPLLQFTAGGHVLGFQRDAVYITAGDHAVKVQFVGGRGVTPSADGEPVQRGGAQPLSRVRYADVWEGVSVNYELAEGGIAKSEYEVAAGASGEQIRLRYNVPLDLDAEGNLVARLATGEMVESVPVAWQEIGGERVPVTVAFRLLSRREVGFAIGEYDPAYPLLVDPVLQWHTFLGGTQIDWGTAVAVDGSGNIYVAGDASSSWGTPVRAYTAENDAFVAKLDGGGNLVWNTFLGGTAYDGYDNIAVDESGNIYVAGWSNATWGSPLRSYSQSSDVFIARLDGSGALQWNTFLGGVSADKLRDLVLAGSGNVVVAGFSMDTWGTPLRAYTPYEDVFVARLNGSGELQWNTFLGGEGLYDRNPRLAVDGSGNVFVAGWSSATWGTPVRAYAAGDDVFVARLDCNGLLQWNTFLGGTWSDGSPHLVLDRSGNVYVAGVSDATWGSPLRSYSRFVDVFVARLDGSGALQWNTFLGGEMDDDSPIIALDESGSVYVAGVSKDTWGSPVRDYSTGQDVFVAHLNGSGALQWHTFLGGTGTDRFTSFSGWDNATLAVDGSGDVYVAGYSDATWGSPVRTYTAGYDVFVARLAESGILQGNTFLGGASNEYDGYYDTQITLNRSGNLIVTGTSPAAWGSPVRAYSAGLDVFVARLFNGGLYLPMTIR